MPLLLLGTYVKYTNISYFIGIFNIGTLNAYNSITFIQSITNNKINYIYEINHCDYNHYKDEWITNCLLFY